LRTDVLALVAALGESYPRELARLTARPLSMVQRAIRDLELAGVLVTRLRGKQREVRLDDGYVAASELASLLEALLERDRRYGKQLSNAARRRPRRIGKLP
jgi:DNA-binding MarR family transcriptional regulator